jgi:hypothetical protein
MTSRELFIPLGDGDEFVLQIPVGDGCWPSVIEIMASNVRLMKARASDRLLTKDEVRAMWQELQDDLDAVCAGATTGQPAN